MTSTERKWLKRVRAWRESGLPPAEFSAGREFAASSLQQWSYRLKRRGGERCRASATQIRVARVERSPVIGLPGLLTVEIGDARVTIPSGADRVTVCAVLGALRGCGVGAAQ